MNAPADSLANAPADGSWRPAPGPVACVGETMAALSPDPAAPLESADLLRLDVAGAESNVAMYLADHGHPARWVSALGDDPFGHRVRARVAACGVDVSGVRTDATRPTGLLVKDPGPDGTRVHYYRRASAASAMGPELLESAAVRSAAVVHLSGITPALSASCRELVEAALPAPGTARPYAVSFDVNYRPALWDAPPAGLLRDCADRADIVLVGLDEAQALWGARMTDAHAVRALLPSPRVLVVKDGAEGATGFFGPTVVTVPALRVAVHEAVGAGDAFAAGFLTGLLRGRAPEYALRLGHLTAAAALRVTGDHGPLLPAGLTAALLAAGDAEWAAASVGGPGTGSSGSAP